MYTITCSQCGRMGNSIFRYMAMILVHHKFRNTVIKIEGGCGYPVSNEIFIELVTAPSEEILSDLQFEDYFQVDGVYEYNMDTIKRYINEHPDDVLIGDTVQTYPVRQIFSIPELTPQYDFVLHLRLEDFCQNGQVMSVDRVIALLDTIPTEELCGRNAIVVYNTGTEFEEEYIRTVHEWFTVHEHPVKVENNDIYTDFHIMMSALVIACSMSTMSWAATLFSERVKKCYFPDYPVGRQTFKRPIENTVLYPVHDAS